MARSFNVSFNITGTLDGSLQAALRNASNAMRGLGDSARAASNAARASQAGLQQLSNSLNAIRNAAQQFKSLQDALKQTSTAFSQSGSALDAAKAKMQADAQAAEQLRQKLNQLNGELNRAKTAKIGEQSGLRALRDQMRQLKQAYAEAKAAGDRIKMTALSSQMSALGAAIQAQQAKVRAAAQAYRELSEKVKQAKTDLKAAEQAASSAHGFSQAQTNVERLRQSYQNQLSALRQLSASLSQAGFNVSNFASSEARLESEINRVNAALERQRALTDAQRRSQEASQGLFNAYGNFQGALQTAETIAAPFKSAVDNATNFEYAMSKVKALTQMRNIRNGDMERVRAEMEELTKQAEELGATTEFTSQEVAEAMGFYGMAGWDKSRIKDAMQHTVDLATIAGDHNIQRMADVLSDDMTAMGLKAGEMITLQTGKTVESSKYFADAFAYALTNANVNRESLHEALKYNAPIAKQWGLTMGEEFAINMMSANVGIKGSMAGTGLRAGLLRISAPPKKAAAAFAEMGLSMSDAQKELAEGQAAMKAYGVTIGDFATTLRSLGQVYNSLGKAERLGFVDAVFGKNASSFWANILDKGNIEDVLKAAQEIDTGWIEDYAADTATVMRDNTKTSIELLKSSMDALERSIGEALTPAIRAAAESFAPLVTTAGQWIAANPAIVQAAAGIAAAIAGIVTSAAAVKLAFAGWEFVTAQVALVRSALASLGSGAFLGGLIGRLAALRTALFGLGGAATLSGWGTMFRTIAAKAAAARVAVMGFFTSLSVSSMASGAIAAIKGVGTALAGAARAAFAFAFSPVGVALMALALAGLYCYQNWDRVGPVLSNIAGIIGGALTSAISTVTAAISAVSSSGAFDGLIASASTLATVVGGTLVKAFAVFLTVAASGIAIVVQLLGDAIKTVIDFGAGMADALGKFSQGDFSGAFDALYSTAEKTAGNIKQSFSHIWDGVVDGAHNVQSVLDALNMPKMPTQAAVARHRVDFDEGGVAHEAPKIDTSATQAGLDAVGQAAQTAATQMDGVNTAAQNISQVGDALGNLPAAVDPATQGMSTLGTQAQTAATNVQSIATNAQTAGTNVGTLGTNAGTASGTVQTLGTNAGTAGVAMGEVPGHAANLNAGLELPIGNLGALGDAAGGAVGNIDSMSDAAGRVAGALSAKASEIAAIHIQVPTVSTGAAPAANAEGGIYRKGAFLTTFAERSPEAAIPIERSKRAMDLWTTVGQMIGILPGEPKTPWDGLPTTIGWPRIPRNGQGGRAMTPRRHGRNYQEAYNKITPTVQRAPWRIQLPRSTYPPMGTPTFPPHDEDSGGGGLLGRLGGLIMHDRQAADSGLPPIQITLNLTVNGNADAAAVRQGVEDATPTLQRSLAFELRNYKREQLRRSFA